MKYRLKIERKNSNEKGIVMITDVSQRLKSIYLLF